MRRRIAFTLIAVIAMACIFIGISMSSTNSTISIKNNTDSTISGLKIIYSDVDNAIEIPEILQKQVYRTKLILPDSFSEGSIKLLYLDYSGAVHEEYIEGYIEKGYKKKIRVTVDSVDDRGVLTINIDK